MVNCKGMCAGKSRIQSHEFSRFEPSQTNDSCGGYLHLGCTDLIACQRQAKARGGALAVLRSAISAPLGNGRSSHDHPSLAPAMRPVFCQWVVSVQRCER